MYRRQAASDFAICHVHDRFLFTVGSLFGKTSVAALPIVSRWSSCMVMTNSTLGGPLLGTSPLDAERLTRTLPGRQH